MPRSLPQTPAVIRCAILGNGNGTVYILPWNSRVGTLLRQFGWEDYRRFFHEATSDANFAFVFGKCFGQILERAEKDWGYELLQSERSD